MSGWLHSDFCLYSACVCICFYSGIYLLGNDISKKIIKSACAQHLCYFSPYWFVNDRSGKIIRPQRLYLLKGLIFMQFLLLYSLSFMYPDCFKRKHSIDSLMDVPLFGVDFSICCNTDLMLLCVRFTFALPVIYFQFIEI